MAVTAVTAVAFAPVRVELSRAECLEAGYVGVGRRVLGIKERRSEPHGTPQTDLWGNDIESAGAEKAVAKVTNEYWRSELRRSLKEAPPDFGDRGQVRWSAHQRGDLHLMVYEKDPTDHNYFFVTGAMPCFNIVGWLPGVEAKQKEYWDRTPRGVMAYWIDQKFLRPVAEYFEYRHNGYNWLTDAGLN